MCGEKLRNLSGRSGPVVIVAASSRIGSLAVALAAAMGASALLAMARPAAAASISWKNAATSTDFETGANWTGGSAPTNDTSTDYALFSETPGANQPVLSIDRSIGGLYFGSGGWTLGTSSNTLTLGSIAGSTGGSVYSGSGTNTINANIALGSATSTWDVGSTLIVNGVISGTGELFKDIDFGDPYYAGGGTLTLNNANSYSGGTIIGRGTAAVSNDAAFGTGTVQFTGGSFGAPSSGTLTAVGARTFSNTFASLFNVGSTSNNIEISGPVTFGSSANGAALTYTNNAASGKVTISGTLTNNAKSITLSGVGTWQIAGAGSNNTSTQDSTQGLVVAGSLVEFNKTASDSVSGGAVTIASTGTARWLAASQMASNAVLNVAGTADLNGNNESPGTINLTGGTVSNVATLSVSGLGGFNTAPNITSAASSTTATISGGSMTLSKPFGSGVSGISVAQGTTASGIDLSISSNITSVTGSDGGYLHKAGTGTLRLSGTNTYSANTQVQQGTLLVDNTTTGQGNFYFNDATGTNPQLLGNATLGGIGSIGLAASKSVTVTGNSSSSYTAALSPGTAGTAIGTLSVGSASTNSVVFGNLGKLAIDVGSGANNNDLLAITGSLNTSAAGNTLALNMSAADQGKYKIVSYTNGDTYSPNTSANGGFSAVTGLGSAYRLNVTSTTGSGEVDLIHKGTIGAITPQSGLTVVTGGAVPFTFTVANAAPTSSDNINFSVTAGSNVGGSVSGSTAVTPQSSSPAISGLTFTGTTVGTAQTGSFTISDSNASNSPQTGTVTVNVLDHAHPSLSTTPGDTDHSATAIVLPSIIAGASAPAGSISIYNLLGLSPTAGLTLTGSSVVSGSGFTLGTLPGTFAASNITPASLGFNLSSTATPATYTEEFSLATSDDITLPGHIAGSTLYFTVTETVNPAGPISGNAAWAVAGSGTWEPGANWTPANTVPSAAGDVATFADAIGASPASVTLGSAKTVGTVTFANTLGGVYTVAGATLTLDGNGSGAAINVNSGSANISAPITLNSNTTVTVAGTSTLNLPQAISGAGTVTKAGTGTATIAGASTGTTPVAVTLAGVTVNAGTLALAASSSQDNRTVLVTNGLTMGGGTLEINNNDVLVHTGSITNVTTEIGNGAIHSQSAVSDTSGRFGIGSILNTDGTNPITSTFGGQPANQTDVLIKYTYLGDANLDGVVNGTDYTRIDAGYGNATLKGWFNGDFNYDGTVDGSDYSLIDGSFGAALTQLPANASSMIAAPAASIAGPVAVPEPTTLGLVALGATALLARRTRRSK